MIIVKVGGSLYDLPDLKRRLTAFLGTLGDPDRLVVPGGGAAADAVRALDATHSLGEVTSHSLALRACTLNAHFLAALLTAEVIDQPRRGIGLAILDSLAFVRLQSEALPASWDATSDSVAGLAAAVAGAELVLLKSVSVPETMPWPEAAAAGYVDAVLPGLIERHRLRVRAVNLRLEPV